MAINFEIGSHDHARFLFKCAQEKKNGHVALAAAILGTEEKEVSQAQEREAQLLNRCIYYSDDPAIRAINLGVLK